MRRSRSRLNIAHPEARPGAARGSTRDRTEAIIARFESACWHGPWPSIDDYLPDDDDRGPLLIELIHSDIELRRRIGEPILAEDYLVRYPELAAHPQVVRELLARRQEIGPAPPATLAKTPGRLGPFELQEPLGRGAFGVVYRAIDTELDRVVAIKLAHSEVPEADSDADRFLREARHASRLRHPGIVSVHQVGRADGRSYLVCEFVDGTTLRDRIAAGRLAPAEAAELAAQIAEALDHAHGLGVIHRDVKPSNILLDREGHPRVADFGLARQTSADATLTLEGHPLGTPAYMSPEQACGEGRRVDSRSDLYSLGVVLYELLTGEVPFRGSPRMVLAQVLDDDPTPPRRLVEAIPRDLETVCLKAMAKAPSDRYPSALALAEDLRRFLDGQPVRARPLGPARRLWRHCRRRPVVAGLAALAGFAFLGMAWQWWRAEVHLAEVRRSRDRMVERLSASGHVTSALIARERRRISGRNEVPGLVLGPLENYAATIPDDPETWPALAIAQAQQCDLLILMSLRSTARKQLVKAQAEWKARIIEAPDEPAASHGLALVTEKLADFRDGVKAAPDRRFAIGLYEKALSLWQSRLGDRPAERHHRLLLAETWPRLSALYLAEGLDGAAISCENRELILRADLIRDSPADTVMIERFGDTCLDFAEHRRKSNQETATLLGIERIRDALAEALRQSPDTPSIRLGLARCWVEWGRLLQHAGSLDEANLAFRHAEPIIARLCLIPPSSGSRKQARLNVEVGRLEERRGRPERALAAFRLALANYERLAREDSSHRENLAMCEHMIGNMHRDLEQWVDSVAAYRRAETLRVALAGEQPNDSKHRNNLEGTRRNLAEVLAKQSEF